MGWQVGYDTRWHRDIGYGVPAVCDRPGCGASIDRGLAYVCGGEPYGCGLFFCGDHLLAGGKRQMCERCAAEEELPFDPTPDTAEWLNWKLTDESWEQWRQGNPAEVERARAALATAS